MTSKNNRKRKREENEKAEVRKPEVIQTKEGKEVSNG